MRSLVKTRTKGMSVYHYSRSAISDVIAQVTLQVVLSSYTYFPCASNIAARTPGPESYRKSHDTAQQCKFVSTLTYSLEDLSKNLEDW